MVLPLTVRGDTSWESEGSTGEYRPEPLEIEVPRLQGAGLAGVTDAPQMNRQEHLMAVRAGDIGSVHSWELVTAVDGPGTRLTVFLAGCPLRCVYCHNPDTLKMRDGTAVRESDLVEKIARYKAVFDATGGGSHLLGWRADDATRVPEASAEGLQEIAVFIRISIPVVSSELISRMRI